MAINRKNNLLNKDVSSENLLGGGMQGFNAPTSVSNYGIGQAAKPTMPEGFVNFDRLMNQNAGTLQNKNNELNAVAQGVQNEIPGLQNGLHGAGDNSMTDYGLGDLMTMAISASKGDKDAQAKLEKALGGKSVDENKAMTASTGFTSGMDKLNKAITQATPGSNNYGGGSLDYALGDASYGNAIRDKMSGFNSDLDKAKTQSVDLNKQIQDYNAKLKIYSGKMKGVGTDAINASQSVLDNPTSTLRTGDPFYKAKEAQDITAGGMGQIAKYLGIDPNSFHRSEEVMPDWMSTVWNKDQGKWVSPESLRPVPTPEEQAASKQQAAVEEQDRYDELSPELRRRVERMREFDRY